MWQIKQGYIFILLKVIQSTKISVMLNYQILKKSYKKIPKAQPSCTAHSHPTSRSQEGKVSIGLIRKQTDPPNKELRDGVAI